MDSATQSLIQKIAMALKPRPEKGPGSGWGPGEMMDPRKYSPQKKGPGKAYDPERFRQNNREGRPLRGPGSGYGPGEKNDPRKKESSMKSIIDDIIKGAKDNSFGRPVHIQNDTRDWTPLAISKTAGMLMALEQQGYSVKQAAEYLGLTERQVQDIVATVR